jgi:hypothetical protein
MQLRPSAAEAPALVTSSTAHPYCTKDKNEQTEAPRQNLTTEKRPKPRVAYTTNESP